ncbi:indole-3-glycerol phosphate synthase TrpC [Neobacillus terrae]|uniref:indole-3-glycerol phosphate synthase TrpC n=1 Tax=Neobacillus terrae TaxID=3034837 RepID=UPI00140D8194|nr:indole-3-glycerol phosphate synthase TrpC [Neobacillus terrae]NHM29383.1 indole-3-glycerol phosphate synthase TrpC [Neobacillus terrae]
MGTILDKILKEKEKEIRKLKENKTTQLDEVLPKRSLIEKLGKAEDLAVIAEFKRASPSKGIINGAADPVQQAKQYEESGASAISVLTDQTFFKGSFEDLKVIREAVGIPLLCKDFIISRIQIDFANASGADLILLIAAALDEDQLFELYNYAKSKGLEPLVEVHNAEELDKALRIKAQLIGINNRDLRDFNVSLETTQQLAGRVKSSGCFLISESGIFTKEDAEKVRNAGANGILVGEALMRSGDIQKNLTELRVPLLKGAAK